MGVVEIALEDRDEAAFLESGHGLRQDRQRVRLGYTDEHTDAERLESARIIADLCASGQQVRAGISDMIRRFEGQLKAQKPPTEYRTIFRDGGVAALEGLHEYIAKEPIALTPAPQPEGEPVTLTYTNWRGETAQRTITPKRIWWGSTDWHPEPQWLLTAFDAERQADRDFALRDFGAVAPQPAGEAERPRRSDPLEFQARPSSP